MRHFIIAISYLILITQSNGILCWAQKVDNVPAAFESINPEPKTILLKNSLNVPTKNGHLQGIQFIKVGDEEKLIISGSSNSTAYIVQADIKSQKTDRLFSLMTDPFRHAGGIQATEEYVIVGIEDNYIKKESKVCVYSYVDANLYKTRPSLIIERQGEPKQKTAGATGLLPYKNGYLALVANWDSRIWDFYFLEIVKNETHFLKTFIAPDSWSGYQAINLLEDKKAIYAIGFYKKESENYADLILVSKQGDFEPILEKVGTKKFNSANGVDFGSAAGLQVDEDGKLHIWSSQKEALEEIAICRFSQH